MNEDLSFYSLEIGKMYNTSIPRRTGIALYQRPVLRDEADQHYISSFRPDEYFVLLARETNSNINWTKILTSNGKVGWCSWDVGKRFDEINQSL
jgi:hypothetical protein